MIKYPDVKDPKLVGTYAGATMSGGGFVWDDVLEYRVWCHPHDGAQDIDDGNDYYYAFEIYEEALAFSLETQGAESPLALIFQKEYIDEPEVGEYVHIKTERITEWPVDFLTRPKRTANTIPNFFNSNAPNKLDILRGRA